MTFSVFPEYLLYLAHVQGMTSQDNKIKDAIAFLRNIHERNVSNHQGVESYCHPHLFVPFSDDSVYFDISYKIATCRQIRKVIAWCYRNIILQAGTEYDTTIQVRIRIATGMLNKLEAEGYITALENMFYHGEFIKNVNQVLNKVYTEDLPFLGVQRNGIRIHNPHYRFRLPECE